MPAFDDARLLAPAARPADDPSLVFRDPAVQNGLHALLIGVSEYPHLPDRTQMGTAAGLNMHKLSSTALSTMKVLRWLLDANQKNLLHHPLSTCRLLLSSNPKERTAEPAIDALSPPPASQESVAAAAIGWRAAANGGRDGATFFYFAGHGIQRSQGDQVLLLDGFGRPGFPVLHSAVDMLEVRNGMIPATGYTNIARTQFYFVDACRNLPAQIRNFHAAHAPPIFDEALSGLDDRIAPIFFASVPDGMAGAHPDEGTLFSTALLRSLRGGAARPPDDNAPDRRNLDWHVTYASLHQSLDWHQTELNRLHNWNQQLIANGFGPDAPLCYLEGAPPVPIMLHVEPESALACTRLALVPLDGASDPLTVPVGSPHPYSQIVPAGSYEVRATVTPDTPPFAPRTRRFDALPPFRRCRIKM